MPVLQTQIDSGSELFARHRAQMLALIESFRGFEGRVRDTSNAM